MRHVTTLHQQLRSSTRLSLTTQQLSSWTSGEYTPNVEWVKIYDKTNYYKADNDQDNEEAMYGAKITTTAAGFDTEAGNSYGYLTLSQIKDAMTAALGGTNRTDIT